MTDQDIPSPEVSSNGLSKSRPPVRLGDVGPVARAPNEIEPERERGKCLPDQQGTRVGRRSRPLRAAGSRDAGRHAHGPAPLPAQEKQMHRLLTFFIALAASTLALGAPSKSGHVEAN